MAMAKLWYMKFDAGLWMGDPEVRSLSAAARGLWIDMLAIMHMADPRGYLKVGPKVILPDNLSRITGLTLFETEGCLKELEELRIFSRDGDCIYSRRMVREDEIRRKRAAGGSKGGNPLLLRDRKVNPKVEGKVNLGDNLDCNYNYHSSSSSSSSSSGGGNGKPMEMIFNPRTFPLPPKLDTEEFREALVRHHAWRSRMKFQWKPATWEKRLAGDFSRWGAEETIAAFAATELNEYQGVFRPKKGAAAPSRGQLGRLPVDDNPEDLF